MVGGEDHHLRIAQPRLERVLHQPETDRQRLELAGAHAPVPSESFIVSMKPDISDRELERAAAWAASLAVPVLQPTA